MPGIVAAIHCISTKREEYGVKQTLAWAGMQYIKYIYSCVMHEMNIFSPFFSNIVGPISNNTLSGFDSFTMGATKGQVIRNET